MIVEVRDAARSRGKHPAGGHIAQVDISIGGRTAQVAVLRNALTSGRVYGVKTFGEDSMCRHVQQAVVLCCWTFPSDRFFLFFCALFFL